MKIPAFLVIIEITAVFSELHINVTTTVSSTVAKPTIIQTNLRNENLNTTTPKNIKTIITQLRTTVVAPKNIVIQQKTVVTAAKETPTVIQPKTTIKTSTTSIATTSKPTSVTSRTTIRTPATTITTSTSPSTSTASVTSPSTTTPAPTTPLFAPFPEHHWPYTKILAKKGVDLRKHTDHSIHIACPADGDFLTFIRDSALWIDKSLLIRKIWEGLWSYDIIAIAPPKWGKSINLSLFKFFCEIPLDADGFETPKEHSPSHFYFNEGKVVSRDGTIEELDGTPLIYGYEEHMANHPVIHMSGINLRMDDDAESLRIMIHETYKRHKSLLNRLKLNYSNSTGSQRVINAQHLTEFRAFYDLEEVWKLNTIQLTFGIQNLTRLLFGVYRRKVVILFDDYDCFGHRAYFDGKPSNSTDYWSQFARTWETFLRYTFKQNRHLEKAIITGVFKISDPSTLQKYPHHHGAYVFDDENLFPFYGVYEKEFQQMADRRGIDQNLRDEAKQWYGGYRALSHLDVEMYSPYSIAKFWNTLQIRSYQPKSRLSEFAHGLFRRPDFQRRVRSMIESYQTGDHLSIIFPRNMKNLKMNEYVDVQRIERGELQCDAQNEEPLFSFLVSTGYAALHEWYGGKTFIKIRIPNREILDQINATLQLFTKKSQE